jgi:hypothetical protein
MHLKCGLRGLGRLLSPKRIDQALGGDELVRSQEQRGEQGSRLATTQLDRFAVGNDLELAQETKLHCLLILSPAGAAEQAPSLAGLWTAVRAG